MGSVFRSDLRLTHELFFQTQSVLCGSCCATVRVIFGELLHQARTRSCVAPGGAHEGLPIFCYLKSHYFLSRKPGRSIQRMPGSDVRKCLSGFICAAHETLRKTGTYAPRIKTRAMNDGSNTVGARMARAHKSGIHAVFDHGGDFNAQNGVLSGTATDASRREPGHGYGDG